MMNIRFLADANELCRFGVGQRLGREVWQSHDIRHPMHSGRTVSEEAPGRRRSFDRAYDNA